MKTLGIVGGIAPPSTIEYYRYLVAAFRARAPGTAYPHVVIDSIDPDRMLGLLAERRFDETVDYLAEALHRLARAGADLALFASNTPHLLLEPLRAVSTLPLVSIVDAAAAEAARLGLRRVGLLGTAFTMRATFYQDAFAGAGIAMHVPPPDDLALVHDRYMTELVPGILRDETRAEVLGVIARLRATHDIDGLVLGGTELPLLLPPGSITGLTVIDTMRAHVDRAIDRMLA